MNFWQKYKKKIFSQIPSIASLLILFIYLAYPMATYAWEWPNFLKNAGSSIFSFLGSALDITQWGLESYVGVTLYLLSVSLLVGVKALYWLVVSLLNMSVNFSLSTGGINLDAINLGWGVIRDFANMGLIFILVYISISTILNLNGANTYKMLVKVVLVGLLMNFSLVFTNVVIDVSNIVALQFMGAITGSTEIGVIADGGDYKGGIGDRISSSLGIANLMGLDQNTGNSTSFNKGLQMLGVSAVLLLIIFVLGVGAVMFLIRIVKLMGVMIFSPLAFAATILPNTESLAKQWWSELVGNAFLAPVYLFMIYISLTIITLFVPSNTVIVSPEKGAKVTDIMNFLIETNATNDQQANDNIKTILGFALSLGLVASASAVAHKMSAETAKGGGKLAGLAFGTGAGAVAAGGRQIGGRAGQWAYEKYASDDSTFGKFARGTGDLMRKGTWDVRNAPVAGAGIELAGAQAGMKTSEGLVFKDAKASAGGRLKQETDKEAKVEAEEKERKDTVRRLETDKIKADLGDVSKIEGSIAGYGAETDPEKKKAMLDKAIQEKMKKLNPEELLKLIGDDVSDPKKKHLVENLSDKRAIKSLEEKLTDEDKVKLQTLITDNKKNNEPGAKHYTENIKKEAEQKMANDLKNYLSGITIATPDNEISNKIISVSPNIVLNPEVRKIIMQDDAVGLKIRANLKGRALDKLISDAIKGGETSVDDLLKIERNIKMNPSNTAGKKTFDSKRVKELLGRV